MQYKNNRILVTIISNNRLIHLNKDMAYMEYVYIPFTFTKKEFQLFLNKKENRILLPSPFYYVSNKNYLTSFQLNKLLAPCQA